MGRRINNKYVADIWRINGGYLFQCSQWFTLTVEETPGGNSKA